MNHVTFVYETPSPSMLNIPQTPHRVREDSEQHRHLHFSPRKENVSSGRPNPQIQRGRPPNPTSQKRKAHEACLPNTSQPLQMRNPAARPSRCDPGTPTHNGALFHKTNSIKQPGTFLPLPRSVLLIGSILLLSASFPIGTGCRVCYILAIAPHRYSGLSCLHLHDHGWP